MAWPISSSGTCWVLLCKHVHGSEDGRVEFMHRSSWGWDRKYFSAVVIFIFSVEVFFIFPLCFFKKA